MCLCSLCVGERERACVSVCVCVFVHVIVFHDVYLRICLKTKMYMSLHIVAYVSVPMHTLYAYICMCA